MSKAKKHTHKYHKVDIGYFAPVWACALPDCSHHMPAHMSKLVEGRASICWGCGDTLILDPRNMVDDRPTCHNCKIIPCLDDYMQKKGLA